MSIFRTKTDIGEWFAGFEALPYGCVFGQASRFNPAR
jgi:hypothetical protein